MFEHPPEVLATPRVPGVAGLLIERSGLGLVLRHTCAVVAHAPEVVAAIRVPGITGLLIELEGYGLVRCHTFAVFEHPPEVIAAPRAPGVTGLLIKRSGLGLVLRYTCAVVVHAPEVVAAIRTSGVAGFLTKRSGFGPVPHHSLAAFVHEPELVAGQGISGVAGPLIKRSGFGFVLPRPLAGLVHEAEIEAARPISGSTGVFLGGARLRLADRQGVSELRHCLRAFPPPRDSSVPVHLREIETRLDLLCVAAALDGLPCRLWGRLDGRLFRRGLPRWRFCMHRPRPGHRSSSRFVRRSSFARCPTHDVAQGHRQDEPHDVDVTLQWWRVHRCPWP